MQLPGANVIWSAMYCDTSTGDEPAVMHAISADTTVADTIWYDTHNIGSDTIPIQLSSVLYLQLPNVSNLLPQLMFEMPVSSLQ